MRAAGGERLDAVPGLRTLRLWPGDAVDRVGVATFTLAGYAHPLLAVVPLDIAPTPRGQRSACGH